MQIIVVGAGKVGTSLTAQLIREHRVTVIDQEPRLIENIINVYDVMGVCGNGVDYETLEEAQVEQAELFVVSTQKDRVAWPERRSTSWLILQKVMEQRDLLILQSMKTELSNLLSQNS